MIYARKDIALIKQRNLIGGEEVTSLSQNHNSWLVGFVALRPKSTAMVIAGRSVHLTTFFPGQA